jgi:hypothetical protein
MRQRIRLFVLSAALCLPLALPAPAPAQAFPGVTDDVADLSAAKRKKQQRKFALLGGGGVITAFIFAIIMLNAVDRSAARRKIREQQLEREQAGLD